MGIACRRVTEPTDKKGVVIDVSLAVVQDGTVPDAAADMAEGLIDIFLTSGALGELPIVKPVVGVLRGAVAIRDRLFLRKLNRSVEGFGHATEARRAE